MTAAPGQAAAHAFVTGCVKRGITASQAAVPPEGQLATVRGLWADVAQAGHEAITAQEPRPAPELAALREQVRLARQDRDQLRTAVLSLAAELENEAAHTLSREAAEAKRAAAQQLRKIAGPPA